MKFPRHLLLLAAALLFTGCLGSASRYTRFHVTDYRGATVADWIAEGSYRRSGTGYRIKAVERTSGPPFAQTVRYPNGWRTIVDGPHIIRWQCGQPFWLYQMDAR